MLTGTGREELLKLFYRRDVHQISLSVTHQTAIAATNNAERITSTILILVHRLCLVYSRNRVREIKVRLKHPCLHPNNPVDVESGNVGRFVLHIKASCRQRRTSPASSNASRMASACLRSVLSSDKPTRRRMRQRDCASSMFMVRVTCTGITISCPGSMVASAMLMLLLLTDSSSVCQTAKGHAVLTSQRRQFSLLGFGSNCSALIPSSAAWIRSKTSFSLISVRS